MSTKSSKGNINSKATEYYKKYISADLLGSTVSHSCHVIYSRSSISLMTQHFVVVLEYFFQEIEMTPLVVQRIESDVRHLIYSHFLVSKINKQVVQKGGWKQKLHLT